MSGRQARDVALIGAGFIADAHLGAIRALKGVRISAVVDPVEARAAALARRAGGATVYDSVEALLAAGAPDAAHVLTPPPLHRACAEPLLRAGVHVLLEKPMAETAEDCAVLMQAAREGGASLRINHNFVHHPTHCRGRALIERGDYGPVRSVQMRYAAPLRQLEARQFGHWMFDSARNLLLEQAVHPLSLLNDLIGPIETVKAVPMPPVRPASGIEVATDWMLSLTGAGGPAQLHVTLGASFPSWTWSALCSDGVIEVDLFEGRSTARGPHAEIAPIDHARRSLSVGWGAMGSALRGLGSYGAELSRLGPKSDGFNRAMAGAIARFHADLDAGAAMTGETGRRLVALCEAAAGAAPPLAMPPAITRPGQNATYDVAVLGGTGFIGQHLVSALLEQGRSVAVMARGVRNLPDLYHNPRVGVFSGSIGDPAAVANVVARAPQIVNLAHGGGGATREAIIDAMVGGARVVAQAAQDAGAERLLFISSSAALWLGDAGVTVDAATPPDTRLQARADYAAAKVMAEQEMLRLHREEALPVIIMRPAVVVGEGGPAFHSALGAYNTDAHCVGWGAGNTPLPFVLAGDVASGIIGALESPPDMVIGHCFNLVGGVRWSARRYTQALAAATGRPLAYHRSGLGGLMAMEWVKWGAKKIAGRRDVPPPSTRDLRSRAMIAPIDTSIERVVLGWEPVADEEEFHRQAIAVHAR